MLHWMREWLRAAVLLKPFLRDAELRRFVAASLFGQPSTFFICSFAPDAFVRARLVASSVNVGARRFVRFKQCPSISAAAWPRRMLVNHFDAPIIDD